MGYKPIEYHCISIKNRLSFLMTSGLYLPIDYGLPTID